MDGNNNNNGTFVNGFKKYNEIRNFRPDERNTGMANSILKEILGKYGKIMGEIVDEAYYSETISIMEKYGDIIDKAFENYISRLEETTMMVRAPRKLFKETTNRAKHVLTCESLMGKTAERLKLNVPLAKLIAKYHDIGHVFYAHPGERALSDILINNGLGPFYHNLEGARKALRDSILEKTIDEINNEAITEGKDGMCKMDEKILRREFWKILDGIAGHNGEKEDAVVYITPGRTEEDLYVDLEKGFVEPGYDRKMKLATPEAGLMRLIDIISYVVRDLTDAVREEILTQVDDSYAEILKKFGVEQSLINKLNELLRKERKIDSEDYKELNLIMDEIANKCEKVMCDALQYDEEEKKITMEEAIRNNMYALRQRNVEEILQRVTKPTEEQIVESATEKLIFRIKEDFDKFGISKRLYNEDRDLDFDEKEYEKLKEIGYPHILEFLNKSNIDDIQRTKRITQKAIQNSVVTEVNLANAVSAESDTKLELYLDKKVARVQKHVKYIKDKYEGHASREEIEGYINTILSKLENGNAKNYMSYENGFIIETVAQYMATLNDFEFFKTISDLGIISEEQMIALQVPYGKDNSKQPTRAIKNMQKNQAEDRSAE